MHVTGRVCALTGAICCPADESFFFFISQQIPAACREEGDAKAYQKACLLQFNLCANGPKLPSALRKMTPVRSKALPSINFENPTNELAVVYCVTVV